MYVVFFLETVFNPESVFKELQKDPRFKGRHSCSLCCVFVILRETSQKRNDVGCLSSNQATTIMITRQQLIHQINTAHISDSVI